MTRPHFFIVGAPRCGTTAMCTWLGAHPAMFIPPQHKEPCYFGTDMIRQDWPRLSLPAYLDLFAGGGSRLCGEGSTWYLVSHRAAAEIRDFDPQARIIIQLRDPIAMLASAHKRGILEGFEDIEDFGEALAAEPERQAGRRIPRSCRVVNGLLYRELVRFPDQIERFWAAFPREQVHILLHDDLRRDPARAYRGVLEFLGVDPAFRPSFEVVHANREVRSAALHRALNYAPGWLGGLKRLVPAALKRSLRRGVRRVNIREAPRQPIDPALRRRLAAELRPDVDRLERLLGRDLSAWCAG